MNYFTTYKYFLKQYFTLFLAVFLTLLLPALVTTFRIYILGTISLEGIDISSQLAWVNVLFEVIQEGMLLPLFFIYGRSLSNKSDLINKFKTTLILSIVILLFASLMLMIFIVPLLEIMDQKPALIQASSEYIRLELLAIPLSTAFKLILVFLVLLKKTKEVLLLLLFQTGLTILGDATLVNDSSLSMGLGVNGIALSNLGASVLVLFISLWKLKTIGFNLLKKERPSFLWISEWWRIGKYSSFESLIRNAVFILAILKMVNRVEEQAAFWIANGFIWNWLLLPVLATGEIIKRNVGEDNKKSLSEVKHYLFSILLICVLWFVSAPYWKDFIRIVLNVTAFEAVLSLTLKLAVFYVIFSFNSVFDNILYGLGRTDLMLYQSIVVNISVYGLAFLLYSIDAFDLNIDAIINLFGTGITVDAFITIGIYLYLKKKGRLAFASS